ncbi:cyclin 2 [Trypanosoma equiperdum]|uniref:Cyclin n=5 Tax=Trypanozoon TaxID=39700 RepID=Q382C9_TRYB2|nr:G1 cyclin, putative [Trypanosoma brucei gambiense DAL972]XP_829464.1 cyclin 2 [Trypanosoma brucei brucei TREU927]RHW67887.1 cyclin 2 [Trypanosoma brucei equiperdum]CAB82894.1 cyclin 2 [Trypanosoma brucei]SCU66229.1 cyclin 2 [Trypanosoma equiperdum]EAN80352.1 cyclin 2 [Trypanosoma brucei brucei TREU927]CBH18452.1 G1 cyclin, putative [Trypanosoma brucei gambiense DAL972]|eukprot:XP_011780716.1 G1 cyclin, putative [Trypanosoma brucei gambiense DAL972]
MTIMMDGPKSSTRATETINQSDGQHRQQWCDRQQTGRNCNSAGSDSQSADPQQSGLHELGQLTAVAVERRCVEQRHLEHLYQSAFHSSHVPAISVWNYMRRIGKYSRCSPECFIICIIFIDRYVAATNCPITFRNIHRLLITSMLVSVKLRDDSFYSNSYFAGIGGVSNEELNRLEIEFLMTIDWRTWVEPSDFNMYCEQLRSRCSANQEQ